MDPFDPSPAFCSSWKAFQNYESIESLNDTTLQDLLGNPGDKTPSQASPPSRSHWWTATLPWFLLLGFAGLAWMLFGKQLLPAKEVQLETVVTLRHLEDPEAQESPGDEVTVEEASESSRNPWEAPMRFQASGWVEPDPLPIKATSLVNGVVDSVAVLEGESVKKGDLLATLIREDFELDLATAESIAAAARSRLAVQEATIRTLDAREETLRKQVRAGELRCAELIDRRDRLKRAGGGAVAEGEIVQATLALQTHEAEVEALAASGEELARERDQLEAQREELKARVREAETEVARRRLALERTEIRSPVDGIVFRLHAVPGQKRMLDMDDPDSSTIAVLFQPGFLQARIDVPLEEASQLSVGQAVRLRSGFLPGEEFRGIVTRIVGEADLQRNTLQAKVKLQDPDPRLRPDMLCRAEFLSQELSDAEGAGARVKGAGNSVSLFVSVDALIERTEGEAVVWTPDAERKTLQRRTIQLGRLAKDGYLPVLEGLQPGDQVVIDPPADLEEGDRYRVKTMEEST